MQIVFHPRIWQVSKFQAPDGSHYHAVQEALLLPRERVTHLSVEILQITKHPI